MLAKGSLKGNRQKELRCVVYIYQFPTINVYIMDYMHVLIKIKKKLKPNIYGYISLIIFPYIILSKIKLREVDNKE